MNLVKFWKVGDKYGFCSDWYKSRLTIDNVDFSCVEQYMMYRKAVLFNDKDIANKVLNTDIPKEIKALGRQVRDLENDSTYYYSNKDIDFLRRFKEFPLEMNIVASINTGCLKRNEKYQIADGLERSFN